MCACVSVCLCVYDMIFDNGSKTRGITIYFHKGRMFHHVVTFRYNRVCSRSAVILIESLQV